MDEPVHTSHTVTSPAFYDNNVCFLLLAPLFRMHAKMQVSENPPAVTSQRAAVSDSNSQPVVKSILCRFFHCIRLVFFLFRTCV